MERCEWTVGHMDYIEERVREIVPKYLDDDRSIRSLRFQHDGSVGVILKDREGWHLMFWVQPDWVDGTPVLTEQMVEEGMDAECRHLGVETEYREDMLTMLSDKYPGYVQCYRELV